MTGSATSDVERAADKISAPALHWRRRSKAIPLPPGYAQRQGDITSHAFLLLGKDAAIAFLNSDHLELGGRPLEIATVCEIGQGKVRAHINDLAASGHASAGAPDVRA